MTYSLSALNRDGLPDLLENITTPEQWLKKRERLLAAWLDYMGGLPERTAVSCELLSEERLSDHYRRHLLYRTADGDQVTAHLLLPLDYVERTTDRASIQFPAMLALHSAGKKGKDGVSHGYGLELVKRGYVVLAPDTIELGERAHSDTRSFYKKYPAWSVVGKMLSDHLHGVDLLCGMEHVDGDRIGVMGHSMGAYNAYFLAGVDRRIKAFAASCGFTTFTGDPRPSRWGMEAKMSHFPHIHDDLQADIVPFEFHEIAALAAPTPAFFWSGQEDEVFPNWKEISEAMLNIKQLYVLFDKPACFSYMMATSGHQFTPQIGELVYSFLDHWLKPQM